MTNKDIFRNLNGLDSDLILKAAPNEADKSTHSETAVGSHSETAVGSHLETAVGSHSETTVGSTGRVRPLRPLSKKLIACAASLTLILGTVSVIGFDKTYAAVRNLFSFLPGVGITESNTQTTDTVLYTALPLRATIKNGDTSASLLRASYANGSLSVTVLVNGIGLHSNAETLSINGIVLDPTAEDVLYNSSLAVSSDSSILNLAATLDPPAETDSYEIAIDGFSETLAFTLKPCRTYAELSEIGPTVTHNDISITATADRTGNELVVWLYETRKAGATSDTLEGFGHPINCAYEQIQFLKTESGKLLRKTGGWTLGNRFVYELADTDETATLHIPYLAMSREENASFTVKFPKDYSAISSDASVKTDFGIIRVTSVERTPNPNNNATDLIRIGFAYENDNEKQRMYSFNYDIIQNSSAAFSNSELGTTEAILLTVAPDETKVKFEINRVHYYLMDEYVMELDINE